MKGSPPHAQGKGDKPVNALISLRITPACAGKSLIVIPVIVSR